MERTVPTHWQDALVLANALALRVVHADVVHELVALRGVDAVAGRGSKSRVRAHERDGGTHVQV